MVQKLNIYHRPRSIEVAKFLSIRNLFDGLIIGIKNDDITIFSTVLNALVTITSLTFKGIPILKKLEGHNKHKNKRCDDSKDEIGQKI